MNILTLIDTVVDGIARSATILDWTNDNYGNDQYVFVNFDIENPPGESYCPFSVIYPEIKQVGQGRSQKSHIIHVVNCLHDSSRREKPGYGNVIEYNGVRKSEEYRKLVETEIIGLSLGNVLINIDVEYDPITDFPFFWTFMAISVEEAVTMGSDYMS